MRIDIMAMSIVGVTLFFALIIAIGVAGFVAWANMVASKWQKTARRRSSRA